MGTILETIGGFPCFSWRLCSCLSKFFLRYSCGGLCPVQTVPVTSSHGRGSIQIISDIGLSEAKIEDFVTPGFGTLRFNGLRRVPSTGERNRKDGLGRDIEGLEDFSKAIPRSNSQVQLSSAPFESSTFEWPQPAEKSDPRPLESQKFRLASRHGTLSVFVSALFT